MMLSCPYCGSDNLVEIEIGDIEADSLYECEDCNVQFRGDEIPGNEYAE